MRYLIFASALTAILFSPAICPGQNPWNIEVIGKAAQDGPLYNYAAYGDFLYIITNKVNPNRYLLSVVDISNPSHPHRLREIAEGEIGYGLLIVDSLLYTTSFGRDSIVVFSLADPSYPQELIRAAVTDYTLQLERLDDNLVGSSQVYAYSIINIEDRLNPGLLMTLDLQYVASNGILIGDYLYITGARFPAYHRYLEVFDISDTLNPSSIYLGDLGYGYSSRMRRNGDYIYLVNYTAGMEIFDINDPANPVFMDTVLTGYPISEMLVSGDYAFGSGFGDSIYTIDLSNPTNPAIVNAFYNQYAAGEFQLNEENLYFTTASVISVLDISNSLAPQLMGRYIPGVGSVDIARWGNYAYLASGYGGFEIFDISDPTDPVGIGYYNTHEQTHKIHISDGILYLADNYSGVLVFSLADPINPELLSTIFLENNAYDMYASDSLLYIADLDGFKIADVSNPSNPVIVCNYQSLPVHNGCRAIVGYGDYIYTAQMDSGFCIYDVSDMTNPFKIDCLESGGWTEIAIRDTILFLSRYDSGLSIFDISHPSNPDIISTTPPSASDLSVWGNLAYLTYSGDGVKIFDITDLNSPESVGTYLDYGFCNGVVVENDTAFVSAGNGGLWILRYESPTDIYGNEAKSSRFSILNNYPNPFNASTTIEFTITESQNVSLTVYDLLGRQVRTLIDDYRRAGSHTVTFGASALSSGVYFYRLQAGQRVETRRMVLLK
jgi:hypothetical protein